MIPVQVLVGVSAWRSSQTHRGEAKASKATAGTGDHLLLFERVSTAGAKRGRTGRVTGGRAEAIVFGPGGSIGSGVIPPHGTIHNHVVIVQVREGRQARGSVGDGRAPAILEGRGGRLEGSRGMRWRDGEFGVRRRSLVLCVRGAGAVHRLLLNLLLAQ